MQITTLSNGMRVATQDSYGQVATFAMFVDAGSMYEADGSAAAAGGASSELGACHFLETTAFKSTQSRSTADVLSLQSEHGIGCSAVFNREVLMFKVDTLRGKAGECREIGGGGRGVSHAARKGGTKCSLADGVGGWEPTPSHLPSPFVPPNPSHVPQMRAESALDLLADAVMNPAFHDEEMEAARRVIAYQRDEAMSQPQVLVSEHLYMAAYGATAPLGRPEKCPDTRVPLVDAATLRAYRGKYFTAPRMVLAAVNVDHDVAVRAAERLFSTLPTAGKPGALTRAQVRSPYVGGDVRSSPDWSSVPATAAAAQAASKTEFTHVMFALPTVGWSHDDVVPVCVVDTLLGGGSSFSAGGPGKGMYSRLYREVLNMNAWVESANAFSAQLYDTGIVGIYGAAPPDYAGDLTSLLAGHLLRLCDQAVKPDELRRSGNQLASSVLMNLETRGLLVEDIGRQILSHGKRLDPAELVHRIRSVTQDDIIRVMREALANPPSFAAVGDVSRIAQYDAIRSHFERQSARWRIAPGSAHMTSSTATAAASAAAAGAAGRGGNGSGAGTGKGAARQGAAAGAHTASAAPGAAKAATS